MLQLRSVVKWPRRSPAVVLTAAALIAVAAGGAVAATSQSSISVCVKHKGGALYSARRCGRHDNRLTWNVQGPPGPSGARGPAGPPTGPAGGALAGSYPNPTLAAGAVGDNSIASSTHSVAVAGGTVVASGTGATLENSFDRLGGTVTVTRTATGVYQIHIPGVTYYYATQITQITPIAGGSGFAAQISSVSNDLVVDMLDNTASPTDSGFSFVVYQ